MTIDTSSSATSAAPIDPARCVLIVDDDPLVRERLELLLGRAGYAVASVSSVMDARALASTRFFPLVILDRALADGDGVSLCVDLRRRSDRGRVFVLVLSARDSQFDVGYGLRAGADAYLSKRTSAAELLAYIEAAASVARFAARWPSQPTRC